MSQTKSDQEYIDHTHNMARFFTHSRSVGWILMLCTLIWGAYSYFAMEKRKDPLYQNLFAVAACPWPGARAEQVEQLVTRKLEETISQNMKVVEIKSISRNDIAYVTLKVDERVGDTDRLFDDLSLRLNAIQDLPSGAGPITFMKDYGDIATLTLTVASPKASDVEISLRAGAIQRAIEATRARAPPPGTLDVPASAGTDRSRRAGADRISIVACYPQSISSLIPRRQRDLFIAYARREGILKDIRALEGNGFIGVDAIAVQDDDATMAFAMTFARDRLKPSSQHPDLWMPTIIHDPSNTKAQLRKVAGDKYSYAELEKFTDEMKRSLQTLPEVSRITRHGILSEQINLDFSQERLASHGIQPLDLRERLSSRNILPQGGTIEVAGRGLPIRTSGEFKSDKEIGDVFLTTTPAGAPVYLRDIVDISRDYESPPRFLNFVSWKDKNGNWQRSRAVCLAVFMRTEEHIDKFGESVNKALAALAQKLPDDLVILRVSDQPEQVEDNLELFMMSLYEAIILVVLTALIGFWEWRSALLIALSIPTTLAMTFGMMHVLGLDIQQASVAALIISLGLLVDDPVVAGDAIKREMAAGHPRDVASWLGPTKLAHAIMYATITNIAAYLPLLMISGEVGQFIFSVPIVITCSLIASRIVSMTFVPLLGYYLLRPPNERQRPPEESPSPIIQAYLKAGRWVLRYRLPVFATSVILLIGGFVVMSNIKTSFFPNDVFNISWVDVWLPEGSSLTSTNEATMRVEDTIGKVTGQYAQEKTRRSGKNENVLESITTFLGGSGPRFWSSIIPEFDQLNYAQVIVRVIDKHDTDVLIPKWQRALSLAVPEARCDVRQLEGGKPVGMPVSIRISGDEPHVLDGIADQVESVLSSSIILDRVRRDWGRESLALNLDVNSDRANLAGLTNQDVAGASQVGVSGYRVDVLRENDKQIPIIARMRAEESSQIQGLSDMYVYSIPTQSKVPLSEVATVKIGGERMKICRRNQFRTVTVGGFVVPGRLASEVMNEVRGGLEKIKQTLPPGYRIEIGGEEEEQLKSFGEMLVVMTVSVVSIFLCLVLQFKSGVKPLLVFAGIPFGMLGALVGLTVMGKPFGFPAFMGVASLAGVIVSHIIVLFDFIEESREESEPLERALLHASLLRLRPVVITISATVLGFIPLAMHGGPLWEPLCYAQIGGLTFATFVTLGLVPVIYAIAVKDLKIIRWAPSDHCGASTKQEI